MVDVATVCSLLLLQRGSLLALMMVANNGALEPLVEGLQMALFGTFVLLLQLKLARQLHEPIGILYLLARRINSNSGSPLLLSACLQQATCLRAGRRG